MIIMMMFIIFYNYSSFVNVIKNWCGPRWVRSSGDFDDLDAFRLQFLGPQASPTKHEHANKKKAPTINKDYGNKENHTNYYLEYYFYN